MVLNMTKIIIKYCRVKNLLTLFVLFFSSLVFAEDISDFEIEGMSIGDSLLDHVSQNKIKKSIAPFKYKTNEYKTIILEINNLKTYDSIEITYKTDDPSYRIQMVTGLIFYNNEINKCKKQKNHVLLKVEDIFKSKNIQIYHQEQKHAYDLTGKSLVSKSTFVFDTGDFVDIECYDWSADIEEKHPNWRDNFRVSIVDESFNQWLIEVQYKQ